MHRTMTPRGGVSSVGGTPSRDHPEASRHGDASLTGQLQEDSLPEIRATFSRMVQAPVASVPGPVTDNARILQAAGPLAYWPSGQYPDADGGPPSQDSLPPSHGPVPGYRPTSLPARLEPTPPATPPAMQTLPPISVPQPPSATWHAPRGVAAPIEAIPATVPIEANRSGVLSTSGGTPIPATVTFRPAASTRHYGSTPDVPNVSVYSNLPSHERLQPSSPVIVPHLDKEKQPHTLHELHILKIWPAAFTFCCIILFVVPIWLTTHLAHDRTVTYWIGSLMRIVMLIPALFVIGHIMHQKKKRPYKPAVLLCMLAPSIILLAFNDATMTAASDKADQLFSTDCDTFTGKRELQRSWDAALELYEGCLKETVRRTAVNSNLTLEVATNLYRIQDCEEYPSQHYMHKKEWEYLWYLEEEHSCAGWCTFGKRLWTFQEATDACSIAASQVFSGKVTRISQQVVLYSVVVLVSTSVALIGAGPFLRARGIDW